MQDIMVIDRTNLSDSDECIGAPSTPCEPEVVHYNDTDYQTDYFPNLNDRNDKAVLSIDVGFVNLGYTIFNTSTSTIVDWDCRNIQLDKVYNILDVVEKVHSFIRSLDMLLMRYESVDVVIEKQQQRRNSSCSIPPSVYKLGIIEGILHSYFVHKYSKEHVFSIDARLVKFYFNIMAIKKDKKQRTIEMAKRILRDGYVQGNMIHVCSTHKARFNQRKKKDDMADSLLMCLYFVFDH